MAVEELAEVMSRKGVESADGLAQGDECRRLNPVDDRAERAAAGEQEDVCDAVGFAGEECAHEVLDVGDAGGMPSRPDTGRRVLAATMLACSENKSG